MSSYNLEIIDNQYFDPSTFITQRKLTRQFVTGTSITVGTNLGSFTPEFGDPLAQFVADVT